MKWVWILRNFCVICATECIKHAAASNDMIANNALRCCTWKDLISKYISVYFSVSSYTRQVWLHCNYWLWAKDWSGEGEVNKMSYDSSVLHVWHFISFHLPRPCLTAHSVRSSESCWITIDCHSYITLHINPLIDKEITTMDTCYWLINFCMVM